MYLDKYEKKDQVTAGENSINDIQVVAEIHQQNPNVRIREDNPLNRQKVFDIKQYFILIRRCAFKNSHMFFTGRFNWYKIKSIMSPCLN